MDRRNQSIINCFLFKKNNKITYTFNFIFTTLGIKHQFVNSINDADVCYGVTSKDKLTIPFNENDIIDNQLLSNNINYQNKAIQFDIINAIYNFLSDKVNSEYNHEDLDQHDRITYINSFQKKNKIGKFPIINIYIKFLKDWLNTHLQLNFNNIYPKGKKATIILSHDVDNPGKYDSIINYNLFPKTINLKNLYKHFRFYLGTVKVMILDKERDENWNFYKIHSQESKYNFKSTYFFATVNNQSREGHKLDVPYVIRKKKYKKVIQFLKKNNQSIGLHASYNAYKKSNNFNTEKHNLKKVSNSEIDGIRHHYWHLGSNIEQTLLMHEKNGFRYDSSLAFNNHLGFRYNIAFPFFPYSQKEDRPIKVLQLPVFCMDGNLFRNSTIDPESALSIIKDYIKVIKDLGGTGVIDWHINTSFPGGKTFKNWGACYQLLLKELSLDTEIWVTDCEDFTEWWLNKKM